MKMTIFISMSFKHDSVQTTKDEWPLKEYLPISSPLSLFGVGEQ